MKNLYLALIACLISAGLALMLARADLVKESPTVAFFDLSVSILMAIGLAVTLANIREVPANPKSGTKYAEIQRNAVLYHRSPLNSATVTRLNQLQQLKILNVSVVQIVAETVIADRKMVQIFSPLDRLSGFVFPEHLDPIN